MTKNLTLILLFASVGILLVSFNKSTNPEPKSIVSGKYIAVHDFQQNWNDCISKADSKWGGQCLNYGFSESKYSVSLVNTCTDVLDLMCAVQRENERWRIFYRFDMRPSDTLHAYACRGNGKYLKWVRKAGDITVKFPSMDEVNEQY